MPRSSQDRIVDLNTATKLSDQAANSEDLASRLGSLVLNAGMLDLMVIQTARVIEQTLLKSQMLTTGEPQFSPGEDSWFYRKKIPTRKMLKMLRKHLPFPSEGCSELDRIQLANEAGSKMIDLGLSFLADRDLVVHRIGHPDCTLDELFKKCDAANQVYLKFREENGKFMEALNPFILSKEQFEQVKSLKGVKT